MKKILTILLCWSFVLTMMQNIVASEENKEVYMENKGTIYVNNTKVNNKDTVLIIDNQIFIPLRTILEALDSKVYWEESTGNIYFDFAEIEYVCKVVVLNSYYPDEKSLLVCKVQNINSTNNDDYIQLNPWAADGAFEMINDRTYLYRDTAERLLKALGCSVEIDEENHVVRISN